MEEGATYAWGEERGFFLGDFFTEPALNRSSLKRAARYSCPLNVLLKMIIVDTSHLLQSKDIKLTQVSNSQDKIIGSSDYTLVGK